LSFRGLGPLWPMREITFGIARVAGISAPADAIDPKNYGETYVYALQALWLLVVAVVGTVVWSALRSRQKNHVTLHKWFRVFVRLGLAAQMLEYGMTKVIPTQFSAPSLHTLVTPVGNLSMNELLWAAIGAAPAYEIFTGCAELLAGILLLIPRTTMIGALICLADLSQVFALNMAYDIGLKLTTVHLILITLFLLAPDVRRLLGFFVFNRPVAASPEGAVNRTGLVAQILVGVYLLGSLTYINLGYWYAKGGGSPKSALYGIWDVEALTVDGQTQPSELNDYDRRWRRAIFETPGRMVFQRTDDSFARYGASIDEYGQTIALTKGDSKVWKAPFHFERDASGTLKLTGEMDGHRIEARLRQVEFDTLPILNSAFRWLRRPAQ